jgi:hypothetical protein
VSARLSRVEPFQGKTKVLSNCKSSGFSGRKTLKWKLETTAYIERLKCHFTVVVVYDVTNQSFVNGLFCAGSIDLLQVTSFIASAPQLSTNVTKFPNLSAAAAASLKVFGVIVYVLTKS